MGRAKDILVKVINKKDSHKFCSKIHYSGKGGATSRLHFGVFLDKKLHGVMQFGSPIDKRKVINLVNTENKKEISKWNEMLELNRMAFDDYLPRNSESRALSIAFKLIKKNAPQIKWILSFSDGTQCGDGTIYRASGFKLTNINKNKSIVVLPDGSINVKHGTLNKDFSGAKSLNGYQLRYIKLLSNDAKLNCKEIPFSKIDEIGAGMYKGKNITLEERKKEPSI